MDQNYIYFKNSLGRDYCTLRYVEHNKMISIIWKGTATEESIKEVKNGVLAMIKKHNSICILNDVQDFFSASSRILAQLTESDWDKEVCSLGVRHIAHVLKEGTPVPELFHHQPNTPDVKFFFHKMDALEWIKKNT